MQIMNICAATGIVWKNIFKESISHAKFCSALTLVSLLS